MIKDCCFPELATELCHSYDKNSDASSGVGRDYGELYSVDDHGSHSGKGDGAVFLQEHLPDQTYAWFPVHNPKAASSFAIHARAARRVFDQ